MQRSTVHAARQTRLHERNLGFGILSRADPVPNVGDMESRLEHGTCVRVLAVHIGKNRGGTSANPSTFNNLCIGRHLVSLFEPEILPTNNARSYCLHN
jgi:hypothetical protein